MHNHNSPIFCLKWNPKGNLIVTGGSDNTAIVWDSSNGEARQTFGFHDGPCLDVSWRDHVTFATCSADKHIYINQMGSFEPLQQFVGHDEEVNSIRWDSTNLLLASSSDDCTAKIWKIESEEAIFTLKGHKKEVYIVRWAPATSQFPMLAT